MTEATAKIKILHEIYYPPEISIEISKNGEESTKRISLPTLTELTDIPSLAHRIIAENHEFRPSQFEKLKSSLYKILDMQFIDFYDFQVEHHHKTHVMPLLDCQFNKMGDRFVTSSYDRTAQVWDTESGECLAKFTGHTNAVYTCKFNLPFGNLVGTGSFDRNAAIWSISDKSCVHMLSGHTKEVVAVAFDPTSKYFASGSMDATARIWSVDTGDTLNILSEHTKDIVSVEFHHSE